MSRFDRAAAHREPRTARESRRSPSERRARPDRRPRRAATGRCTRALAALACVAVLGSSSFARADGELWSVQADAAWDGFAHRVVALPDVDGDGARDLAVSVLAERAVEIRSGRDGALLGRFTGPESFGFELAVVTHGGAPTLLVGAPLAEELGQPAGHDAGRVSSHALPSGALLWSRAGDAAGARLGSRLADGGAGAVLAASHLGLGALDAATGEPLPLGSVTTHWADGLIPVGDIDGDGRVDLARGASPASGEGWAKVWSGLGEAERTLLHQFRGDGDDGFGWSLAPAGDLDGDGADDLLVGAPGDDAHAPDAGALHVLSGRTGAPLYVLRGQQSDAHLGGRVGLLGDVDGDGRVEVFFTSFVRGADGRTRAQLTVHSLPDEFVVAAAPADDATRA